MDYRQFARISTFPAATVKKNYSYQPTVSVLMPCFNEGKTVYETKHDRRQARHRLRYHPIQGRRSVDCKPSAR